MKMTFDQAYNYSGPAWGCRICDIGYSVDNTEDATHAVVEHNRSVHTFGVQSEPDTANR